LFCPYIEKGKLGKDIVRNIKSKNRDVESVIRDSEYRIRDSFIMGEWEEKGVVDVIKLFLYTL
jgi:hypothetical protein